MGTSCASGVLTLSPLFTVSQAYEIVTNRIGKVAQR